MKVRLSEKVSEIFGQVSEKTKLESLAGLPLSTGTQLFIYPLAAKTDQSERSEWT